MLTDCALVINGIAAGCILVALYRWFRAARIRSRRRSPTGWQHYRVLPFGSIRLKKGSLSKFNDHVMRRRLADGLWEYRWPTEAEAYEEWESGWWF